MLRWFIYKVRPDLAEKVEEKTYFYRCITPGCGRLLGYEMIRAGTCAGHKVQGAQSSTLLEDLKILAGRIY